jgi:two-component system, response regulator PdtaR
VKRFLFVDDNFDFAENLAEILSDNGDQVTIAGGGLHALELIRENRFDALVTDMRMPVMSGAALVHEVRRLDPGLPAIVITAYTGEADLEAARKEGILAILPKPVPIRVLMTMLRVARRDGLVALVEDDFALADNLAEALRDLGFSSINACSVAETERLGGLRLCAALVDLRIAGAPDGAALKLLFERNPQLPILVMSAHDEALRQAAWPVAFAKPFDSGKLLAAVEKLWH